ncbi:MAG: prepilin-type N-terminal cleavage/methylation domain-containing protein [Acidobacteria bacterium]|nr:prepilin-type N-terminal cleavage/methylation domain-containing protein [Acidobacteriota bacterium]
MTGPLVRQEGFTLVETLIAMLVLSAALLALAQVFALGLTSLAAAAPDIIAREKAAEAVESVYTARDTRTITWDEIRNEADGGVFLDGPQPLTTSGADGLVNTGDDGAVETITKPGPDNQLGTEDDLVETLTQFTREIEIQDVGPNLREIRVTIEYVVGAGRRQYTVETLIAAFA